MRPASAHKPAILRLQERGVQIRKCDLKASEEQLIEALAEIDIVVSCVGPAEQQDQIPLAKAAKRVGIKRFIPCGFITPCPPGGVMWLRDEVCVSVHPLSSRRSRTDLNDPEYRKRLFTTRFARFGCLIRSSMSVGGISCLILASLRVAWITP